MSITIRLLSLLLLLWTLPSDASTRVGVYAIIDEVALEPADLEPERILISGVFVVPQPISSGLHQAPARGHLYFSLNPDSPQATRTDWRHLQASAGTGRVIGFGQYWMPCSQSRLLDLPETASSNCSLEVEVHAERVPSPEPYPAPSSEGIVTAFDSGDDICPRFGRSSGRIVAELREMHSPGIAQDEPPVCPERIGLVSNSTLDRVFLEQGRAPAWAADAEALILRRLTEAPSLRLSSLTVECRDTICHIDLVFPTLAYQNDAGNRLAADALKDLPGFSSGAKIVPSHNAPSMAYYIQRRKVPDSN
jgi:hypothetical protein